MNGFMGAMAAAEDRRFAVSTFSRMAKNTVVEYELPFVDGRVSTDFASAIGIESRKRSKSRTDQAKRR
jgi:hypothetical protein